METSPCLQYERRSKSRRDILHAGWDQSLGVFLVRFRAGCLSFRLRGKWVRIRNILLTRSWIMWESTPAGNCSPEKSAPTRLGLGTDKMDCGVGVSSSIALLSDPSLRSGDIQDRSCTVCRSATPALVAWLLMALRSCVSKVWTGVLTTKWSPAGSVMQGSASNKIG